MKFQYLGTAAAEGWPAMFCECDNCRRAAQAGGRNIRTRSQALIDDRLLIDFPADTYWHMIAHGLPLPTIQHCIVTHSHSDHLYPADLEMRRCGFAHFHDDPPAPFTLYATARAGEPLCSFLANYHLEKENRIRYQEIRPFEAFEAAGYTIVPLQADHDPQSGPVFFDITDGQKRILYANDTGYFPDSTWQYLETEKPRYDFVSLDCTGGLLDYRQGHMGLNAAVEAYDRLRTIGCADDATVACIHHFSHNGGAIYDEMVPLAAEHRFLVAYDGMVLDI